MNAFERGDTVSVQKERGDAWFRGTVQAVDNINQQLYLDVAIEDGVVCLVLPTDQARIRR